MLEKLVLRNKVSGYRRVFNNASYSVTDLDVFIVYGEFSGPFFFTKGYWEIEEEISFPEVMQIWN